MTLPPRELVESTLTWYVALPFALAAVGSLVGLWRALLGIALGLLAGIVGVHFVAEADVFAFLSQPEQSHHWLPWVTVLAVVHGFAARSPGVPLYVGLALRAEVAYLAAWALVPAAWAEEHSWLTWTFAGAVLVQWLLLDGLSYRLPGGLAPLTLAVMFAGATWVLLTHFASMADWSLVLSSCWLGIAVVAWWGKIDCSGVLGSGVVPLSGALINGAYNNFSEVPNTCHWIVAFAPSALLPMLLLARPDRRRWQLALMTLPLLAALGVAVWWALSVGGLPWEEEQW